MARGWAAGVLASSALVGGWSDSSEARRENETTIMTRTDGVKVKLKGSKALVGDAPNLPGARCRGRIELFFSVRAPDVKRAEQICAGCPERRPCLEASFLNRELFGTWGGVGEARRRAVLGVDPNGAVKTRARTERCPDCSGTRILRIGKVSSRDPRRFLCEDCRLSW